MYLVSMPPLLAFGYVTEMMMDKGWLTRTNCRKSVICIACLGSALCFALVPLAGCKVALVTNLLLIGNVFLSLDSDGTIEGEISKDFATTVFALVNMCNTSAGFIVPYVVGLILQSGLGSAHGDLLEVWSIVFYQAAGMAVLGAIIFLLFGSAERQPWDYDTNNDETSLVAEGEDGEESMNDPILEQQ